MKNLNVAEIMEMRRQAEELLKQAEEQRTIAIQYYRQQLIELKAEDVQATIVNNITINKGKVIEITKEDNSTIEMLRETIRQMNQTINDMNKEHDELYKLYLEEQREKEVWAAAHDELKDELEVKEAIIENLKAQNKALNEQLKEEKEIPKVIRRKDGSETEVADDPLYNEPEDKPITEQLTKDKIVFDLAYEELESHDGAKVKVKDLKKNIMFYALIGKDKNKKNGEYCRRPSYSLDGKRYTRKSEEVAHLYQYDEQLTEELMSRIYKRFNKKQTAKESMNNEQKVNTNKTKEEYIAPQVDDDPMTGAEDLDL